jgi:hypothetical protein
MPARFFSLAFVLATLAACGEESGYYHYSAAEPTDFYEVPIKYPSDYYSDPWSATETQAPNGTMIASANGAPNAPSSRAPNGHFGVCNRYADQAADAVNAKAQDAVNEVQRQNLPAHVVNAHMTIIQDAHARGMSDVQSTFNECVSGFKTPQDIVDIATLGFSRALESAGIPEGRVRIDASEIATGRPLGGDEALVPKAREQVLGGDTGTGANILRDPIRCITFMRKC